MNNDFFFHHSTSMNNTNNISHCSPTTYITAMTLNALRRFDTRPAEKSKLIKLLKWYFGSAWRQQKKRVISTELLVIPEHRTHCTQTEWSERPSNSSSFRQILWLVLLENATAKKKLHTQMRWLLTPATIEFIRSRSNLSKDNKWMLCTCVWLCESE